MATIRCPHCGSPARVRGRQWECGWCGNYGWLSQPQETEDLDDLERGVFSILNGMKAYLGSEEAAKMPTWELTAYGISHALLPRQRQTDRNRRRVLAFFDRYPVCSGSQVWSAACSGKPAFEDRFRLTEKELGSFWESLLPKLPPYASHRAWPHWLYQMADGLSQVESFFSGEDSSDLFDTFQEALTAHWDTYPVAHPDRTALETAVRNWDFDEKEWACRDLLIAAFPDVVRSWSTEELLEMDTMDLLSAVGEKNPEAAIDMMKLLLDTVGEKLQEREVAYQLLGWDMDGLLRDQFVQGPLLQRLKTDDRLAEQIFQCACWDTGQKMLYEACDWFGEGELKERLQALLDRNPYFQGFD